MVLLVTLLFVYLRSRTYDEPVLVGYVQLQQGQVLTVLDIATSLSRPVQLSEDTSYRYPDANGVFQQRVSDQAAFSLGDLIEVYALDESTDPPKIRRVDVVPALDCLEGSQETQCL